MARGINNTARMTSQVAQILATLTPATPEIQALTGFIGTCYTFKDLDPKSPRIIVVDVDNSRIGTYYTKRKKTPFIECRPNGYWNTLTMIVDPNDPKGQSIGRHTATHLVRFIRSHSTEYITTLINTGYFEDYNVNHMTNDTDNNEYLECATNRQNRIHGLVVNRLAKKFKGTGIAYQQKGAKRNKKFVTRLSLKYPLSVVEVDYVEQGLIDHEKVPVYTGTTEKERRDYERMIADEIAEQIAQVWLAANHYMPKYEHDGYPMHDSLRYKYQRRAVLSALEVQKTLQAEQQHADYYFYQYEQNLPKENLIENLVA